MCPFEGAKGAAPFFFSFFALCFSFFRFVSCPARKALACTHAGRSKARIFRITSLALVAQVGDPSSRGAADGPLGPTLPSDMASRAGGPAPSASAAAPSSGAAASPEAAATAAGDADIAEAADDDDEDGAAGVGPRERAWLGATAAAAKGARQCVLVPSCAKALDGAALQVAQVSGRVD